MISVQVLSQIEAAAQAADSLLTGKSEVFIAAAIMVVFVGWTMFQQNKSNKTLSEQHEMRNREDKDRYDVQNQFHRDISLRNADQLDAMLVPLERVSNATEIMARCTESTDASLIMLGVSQRRDRRAIVSVIDAAESRSRGEEEHAIAALKDARNHLIGGDEE